MSQTYDVSLNPEKSIIIETEISGGTTDYERLKNLPSINGVELKGDLSTEDLKIELPDTSDFATKEDLETKADKSEIPDVKEFATKIELEQATINKADKSEIPTKTSQLANDSGFVTKEEIGDVDIDSPVLEEAKQIIDKYAVSNRVLDTENVKSYSSVADGYLNTLGNINPSSTRGTSDYIDLSEYPLGIHIKSGVAGIKDGGYTYACFYDENKVFISNLTGAHGDIGEQDIFNYPENAKYIRLTLTAKGTPLKLMAYFGDKYYDYDIARETDLNTLTAEVNELTERLGDFDVNDMPDTTEINKFLSDYAETVLSETNDSYESIVNAFLNYNGAEVSSTSRGVTDYIDLSSYPVGLHIVSGVSSIQNGAKTYACFYDKDKVFVSNLAHTGSGVMDGTDILEYPENAKYIRFTCTANTTPMVVCGYVLTGNFDIARKKEFETVLTEKVNNSKNYGKSIGVFGGSLSVRQESNVAKQIWKDILNVTVTNYGVGGAGFSSTAGTSIQTQVDGAGVHDVYVLWASTNDCTGAKEIGEWTDYTKLDNYDESKLTTQCGGINYCIKKLYEKNPNAEIYFFTSLRFFSAEYGYNPYSKTTNGVGKTFSEYVEAQKKCCEYNGVPVLDQFNLQGVGLFNYTLYYNSDKLHMNEEGYRKIGHIQAEFLKNGKGIAAKNYESEIDNIKESVATKEDVPTKTSDLINDSDFITSEAVKNTTKMLDDEHKNILLANGTYDGKDVEDGFVFTSPDGKLVGFDKTLNPGGDWGTSSLTGQEYVETRGLYGNGVVCIPAGGYTVNVSSDRGRTWKFYNGRSLAYYNGTLGGTNYCFNGQQFVGLNGGWLYTSTDGVNWSSKQTNAGTTAGLAFGNGRYVTISDGVIKYSDDGLNWFAIQDSTSFSGYSLQPFANGKFIAVGSSSVAISEDGESWSIHSKPSGNGRQCAGGNGIFVISDVESWSYGSRNTFFYSTDGGITWNKSYTASSRNWVGLSWCGDRFFAVAHKDNLYTYSFDGINWVEGTMPQWDYWTTVTYVNGDIIVTCGHGTNKSSVAYASFQPFYEYGLTDLSYTKEEIDNQIGSIGFALDVLNGEVI